MSTDPPAADAERQAIARLLQPSQAPFGPRFFLAQLAGFLRDRCPDPSARLPRLELCIAGAESITVCHVIALSPQWVAVAAGARDAPMRTEIIPYESIMRVTIGSRPPGGIGFDSRRRPLVVADRPMSPEEALATAASASPPPSVTGGVTSASDAPEFGGIM